MSVLNRRQLLNLASCAGIAVRAAPGLLSGAALAQSHAADSSAGPTAGIGAVRRRTLALGTVSLDDWSTELPFLDIVKQARPPEGNGTLDSDGYPTSGTWTIGWAWAGFPESDASASYTVRWTGTGTVSINVGATLGSSGTRTFVLTPHAGDWSLKLSGPINSINVVRTDRLALFDSGEIFNPDFLNFYAGLGYVRYMDWIRTNDSPFSTWSTRTRPSHLTYSPWQTSKGVPWEMIIAAANRLGVEPYITIPHMADDNYVTELATLLRDTLDPSLKVWVEYSNEFWNGGFSQGAWMTEQGRARWPAFTGTDFGLANNWFGVRCYEIFGIFGNVFSGQMHRIKRIIGTQTGNTAVSQTTCEAPAWQTYEPESYVAPYTRFDAVAVTSYYGFELIAGDATNRTNLTQIYNSSGLSAAVSALQRLMLPSLANWRMAILNDSSILMAEYGLPLVLYEGGNHTQFWYPEDNETIRSIVRAHHESVHDADNVEWQYNVWRNEVASAGPFIQFQGMGSWGLYGNWSMAEYYGQPAFPFAQRLYELSAADTPWWEAGNVPNDTSPSAGSAATRSGDTLP